MLFTIVVLFALQGDAILGQPLDVARIALPLLAHFAIMWAGSYALGKAVGAIAVAIATFGVTSGQALAGVPS